MALGAAAVGAAAVGALLLGVLAVGRLAVGRLALGSGSIRRLAIDELVVGHVVLGDGAPPYLAAGNGSAEACTVPTAEERLLFEDLAPGRRFVSREIVADSAWLAALAHIFDSRSEVPGPGAPVSSWSAAILTMHLLRSGGLPLAGGLEIAGVNLAWPRPIRPGDRLRVESEILALETLSHAGDPRHGVATVRSTTLDGGGQAVQVMLARFLVPCRQMPPA